MTGPTTPSIASNEPMQTPLVHYLHEDRALCWWSRATVDWPENERGVALPLAGAADPAEVTCIDCRDARQHGVGAPTCAPRFFPWRDTYGREHPDVPRCAGYTQDRGQASARRGHTCDRKGVVQGGFYAGREAWYCLQHDPARRDEQRVAALAPVLLELVQEALALMPRTKRSATWRRRAEAALSTAETRNG